MLRKVISKRLLIAQVKTLSIGSIEKAGLDPNNLPSADKKSMNFGSGGNTEAKAWKDIWGAGQGVGSVHDAPSIQDIVEDIVDQFVSEYAEAQKRVSN